jgi:hypothetical protein
MKFSIIYIYIHTYIQHIYLCICILPRANMNIDFFNLKMVIYGNNPLKCRVKSRTSMYCQTYNFQTKFILEWEIFCRNFWIIKTASCSKISISTQKYQSQKWSNPVKDLLKPISWTNCQIFNIPITMNINRKFMFLFNTLEYVQHYKVNVIWIFSNLKVVLAGK